MWIAGVDEAGRGPLAGPVFAAAVILNPKTKIKGLTDSKRLNEKKREFLFEIIQEKAYAWAIGRAEVSEIDTVNILQATFLAMQRAIIGLKIKPDLALVDGDRCPVLACKTKTIIQGDLTEPVISAASILAKVSRDREMIALDKIYPHYGFAKHKGYGTKDHIAALQKYGPSIIHRFSYEPVTRYIKLKEKLNEIG